MGYTMSARSQIGYYLEGGKSCLIIKGNHHYAADIFCGTSIEITADSQQHLGAVMGFSE